MSKNNKKHGGHPEKANRPGQLGESTRREVYLSPERMIFNNALERLRGTFQDPLLPESAQTRLTQLLEHGNTSIGDIKVVGAKSSSTIIPYQVRDQLVEAQVKTSNGLYVPPDGKNKIGHVYVDYSEIKRVAEMDKVGGFFQGMANDNLLELLLEEYGHGLSTVRDIWLKDLSDPDNSFLISPSSSVDMFLTDLQRQVEDIIEYCNANGLTYHPPILSSDRIFFRCQGFSAYACETDTNRTFPKPYSHVLLEESRSSLIQTLLEVITYGREAYQGAVMNPADQSERNVNVFSLGVKALRDRMQKARNYLQQRGGSILEQDSFYTREIAALGFLAKYFSYYGINIDNPTDGELLTNFLHRFIESLHVQTFDEFFSSNPPAIVEEYLSVLQGTNSEFRSRRIF